MHGRQSAPFSRVLSFANVLAPPRHPANHDIRDSALSISKAHMILSRYMPEAISGEHAERAEFITCQQSPRRIPTVLEAFLFLVSNNLWGHISLGHIIYPEDEDEDIVAAFQSLVLIGCPLEGLFSARNPTALALSDAVFASTIRLGRVDILRQLIQLGLELPPRINRPIRYRMKCQDDVYFSVIPIQVALHSRNLTMAQTLLDHGAILNKVSYMDNYESKPVSSLECAFSLIRSYETWLTRLESPHYVADFVLREQRNVTEIELLRSLGMLKAPPLCRETQAIVTGILDRLLQIEKSARLESPCGALTLAMRFDHEPLRESIMSSGRDLGDDVEYLRDIGTPLFEATHRKDLELCQALLERGAPADPPDDFSLSALQCAACLGEIEILHLLLAHSEGIHRVSPSRLIGEYIYQYGDEFGEWVAPGFGVGWAPPYREDPPEFMDALSIAVRLKKLEVVKALLGAGARPSTKDLTTAVGLENPEVVEALLDAGAEPSTDDLLMAIRQSDTVIAGQLLSKGAQPGKWALSEAVEMKNEQLINMLIEYGAKICDSALAEYIMSPESSVSHIALSDPTEYDAAALVAAAYKDAHNKTSFVEYLLAQRGLPCKYSHRPDQRFFESLAVVTAVHFRDYTTCTIFARYGLLQQPLIFRGSEFLNCGGLRHPKVNLKRMLRDIMISYPGASNSQRYHINIYGHSTALFIAAIEPNREEREEMVDFLLQHHVKPTIDDTGYSMWRWEVGMCKRLIDLTDNVNKRTQYSGTLLQSATARGLIPIIEHLLEKNVDVDARFLEEGCERTALQTACEGGDPKIVQLLINKGARINAPSARDSEGNSGLTALQLAALQGHMEIARLLIDRGADCDERAAEICGRTALEGAAEHGRLDMLEYLLHSGTRTVGVFCRQYFRAIKFAERETHYAAAQLLKDHRQWTDEDYDSFDKTCLCEGPHECIKCDGESDGESDAESVEQSDAGNYSQHGRQHAGDTEIVMDGGEEGRRPSDNYINSQMLHTEPIPNLRLSAHATGPPLSHVVPGFGMDGTGGNLPIVSEATHNHLDVDMINVDVSLVSNEGLTEGYREYVVSRPMESTRIPQLSTSTASEAHESPLSKEEDWSIYMNLD